MEVDIGFMSHMEIVSSVSSLKSKLIEKDENGKETVKIISADPIQPIDTEIYQRIVNQEKWTAEIDEEEANSRLEKAFYPFKEV
jgi:hypothetical protein